MIKDYKELKYNDVYNGEEYNLPKSYHFFRIEYKEANALINEKIHFENLDCLSKLIDKLNDTTKDELW